MSRMSEPATPEYRISIPSNGEASLTKRKTVHMLYYYKCLDWSRNFEATHVAYIVYIIIIMIFKYGNTNAYTFTNGTK